MRNNRGNSTPIVIIGIVVALGIMFLFPLIAMTEQHDDMALTQAQTIVNEFVNKVATNHEFSQLDVDNLQLSLASTGYAWDPEITIQQLEENAAKKANGATVQVGDGAYVSIYMTQILNQLAANKNIKLNSGDTITLKATLVSTKRSDEFKNSFYKFTGNEKDSVQASAML